MIDLIKFPSKALLVEHLRRQAKTDDGLKVIHMIKKFMIVSVPFDGKVYYTLKRRLKADRPNGINSWALERYLMPQHAIGDAKAYEIPRKLRPILAPDASRGTS